MMIGHTLSLSNDGIVERLNYLNKEVERINYYDKLKLLPEGKFLLLEMKDRLESIRRMYATVTISEPNAVLIMAGLQSEEYELKEWIERIENSNLYLSRMEIEIGKLQTELDVRIEEVRRSNAEFRLPPSDKTKRKKQ